MGGAFFSRDIPDLRAAGLRFGWRAKGVRIRGYALDPTTQPNLFTVAHVGDALEDIRGDVRDSRSLEAAMTEFAPEVVFHLATEPLVRRSYADPLGTSWVPHMCSRRCVALRRCARWYALRPTSVTKTGSGSGPIGKLMPSAVTIPIPPARPALRS